MVQTNSPTKQVTYVPFVVEGTEYGAVQYVSIVILVYMRTLRFGTFSRILTISVDCDA